jgi:hypothetical protein
MLFFIMIQQLRLCWAPAPALYAAALFVPGVRSQPTLSPTKSNAQVGGAGGACDGVLQRLYHIAATVPTK